MKDDRLVERLVVKRNSNGRCTYDEEAKRQLVGICVQPGASVARIARDHGINANLVHTWISLYRKERRAEIVAGSSVEREALSTAFVPVVTTPLEISRELRLDITLDNGIQADLRSLSRDDVLAILPVLASLPCSTSTRR